MTWSSTQYHPRTKQKNSEYMYEKQQADNSLSPYYILLHDSAVVKQGDNNEGMRGQWLQAQFLGAKYAPAGGASLWTVRKQLCSSALIRTLSHPQQGFPYVRKETMEIDLRVHFCCSLSPSSSLHYY